MNKHYKKKLFQDDSSLSTLLKKYLVFLLIFSIILITLSIVTGIIFFNTTNPTAKIELASYISLFISAFVSSFVFSRTLNKRNLVHGLIFGTIIVIISLFISIFSNNDIPFVKNVIIKGVVILICATASLLGKKRAFSKHKFKR